MEFMEIARLIAVLVCLLLNSVMDIRHKEISLPLTILSGVGGISLRAIAGIQITDLAAALIPGILCVFLAFITREQIGYGDAWVLLATGCCLESKDMFAAWMLSLIGIGLVALFVFVCLRKKGTYELPYIPFLFASVICVWGVTV